MKITNRSILITGGANGIGLELASRLLAQGNRVAITGRSRERLSEAQRKLPALRVFQSDVADPEAIERLYTQVLAELPDLSVLVNNAGVMRNLDLNQPRELLDVTLELDVLLRGPIQMTQQFLPQLKAQPDALIVNVTSALAFIPLAVSPVYSAAKAGLHAFTQCLRAQLAGTSIRVVELAPPGTDTQLFWGEFENEMKGQKPMPVTALVDQAVAGLEGGKAEIRVGLAKVLRAMSRLAPDFMFHQLTKMSRPKPAPKELTA